MKRKRHSPEQIIAKLREADAALTAGAGVEQICRQLEISQPTYHKWRKQYGGMKADEMKRLKELERENTRLKKIVADLSIDNSILREVAKGNF
jgi:putative transposase